MRSQTFNLITWLRMRRPRRGTKGVTDLRSEYALFDAVSTQLPPGISTEDQSTPVRGRWLRNAGSTERVILYLHGGGFILRQPKTHTALAASFCSELEASAFLPWYRLAPEHPFPAAPEDCLAAYRHVLEAGHRASDVVLMGDSAGGNLALSTLHLIRRDGLPVPAAAIGLSPSTDLAQVSATWRLNKWRDPVYPAQRVFHPQRHYLQGASPVDPIASPYYGDLSGFPPILIVVGGVEALVDDAVSFVKKAVESGVRAKVHLWRGMPHVFMLFEALPESAPARRRVVEWLDGVALHPDADAVASGTPPLHKSCVEVFDMTPFTGAVRRETNDVYLVD